jgi:hypothetical protein
MGSQGIWRWPLQQEDFRTGDGLGRLHDRLHHLA